VQEAGWTPEPVWTQKLEEKSFASARDLTPVVQSSQILSYFRSSSVTTATDNGLRRNIAIIDIR
jgi:hypothetical protein